VRRKPITAALAVTAILATAPQAAPAAVPSADARAAGAEARAAGAARAAAAGQARAIRAEINQVRVAHGLPPVRGHRRLARAARAHSRDMVRRGYFSHVSPNGETPSARVRRAGYPARRPVWRVGETIAWAEGAYAAPAAVVRTWLESPPHRAILLSRSFREVGLGLAAGGPTAPAGTTVTADFASRR
jgi:uncharacterized protein YkwD